ncbi:uncharacterized protein LOC102680338 [Apis dorsata]|uniref:Uncharacterized protein LOC102655107 n=1 Tax=Apis mellifera TaxID=7460 RepID=A0A7M7GKX1_APIME|nr:uncharacterized protein LOC102655107 [Apis mellifera]XP_006613269.1 uncharacterized protein LOC102680338 [Apis dorsata]|eukprot:XP_006558641.1 uncharacterized protein LOC102655107 [Apis mellifera]
MWFHNISRSLTDKLNSLWKLAEAYQPTENEIKQFADQISNSWTCVNRQIYEKYSKIRMASRTLHGVPLSLLLDKIKKEIFLLKQICESAYDHEYILKGYKLINESEELINILKKCDSKLQQYLSISNITPHLIKLESAIDKYVTNVELLPTKKSFLPDLNIFSLVAKLLTGELLGYESIDPNYVLIENMPKKPVFIIKNVKRKTIYPYYPT